eukprot:3373505-Rhodomonas_salina.1
MVFEPGALGYPGTEEEGPDGGRAGWGGDSGGRRESSRREVVPRCYMPVAVGARTGGREG